VSKLSSTVIDETLKDSIDVARFRNICCNNCMGDCTQLDIQKGNFSIESNAY